MDADPLRCQQDMEAEVGHQVAEVDPLRQVVVAILQLLQALVNASALQEKAAWLGGWEKRAPIIVTINWYTQISLQGHECCHPQKKFKLACATPIQSF